MWAEQTSAGCPGKRLALLTLQWQNNIKGNNDMIPNSLISERLSYIIFACKGIGCALCWLEKYELLSHPKILDVSSVRFGMFMFSNEAAS